MSKERAKRRAEREAARAAEQAVRLRRARRRERRQALLRRLTPKRRRSAWGLGRRSPAQRSLIVGIGVLLLLAVWFLVESLATRLGLTVLVLLLLPVVAVVSFDRKGMRL
jgi:Flp pilus assembly protein TadB